MKQSYSILALTLAAGSWALPHQRSSSNLVVDLEYAQYQGYHNETAGLNIWKGIRYAQAERWQLPHTPAPSTELLQATQVSPPCPQSTNAGPPFGAVQRPQSEDCLFLNVWSPPEAQDLPVFVWIHGGGYNDGDGNQDFAAIMNDNGNNFIVVSIQYRLGAFGFLASQDVYDKGAVNVGLLDQQFSLEWVQKNIDLFGGDAQRVTLVGQSAGGGSVLHHGLATNRDSDAEPLFEKLIAASPFIPALYEYNSEVPTNAYKLFASSAGCSNATDVFACLTTADYDRLQAANNVVSMSGTFLTWTWYPVYGDAFIPESPWKTLSNPDSTFIGSAILVGNNADEGINFVPQNITNKPEFQDWIELTFSELGKEEVAEALNLYALPADFDSSTPRYETNGYDHLTSISVGPAAVGYQQSAFALLAEANFICPAYWSADLFSRSSAFRYQYSVPLAAHGFDLGSIYDTSFDGLISTGPQQPEDFNRVFRQIWGNFITQDDSDPSVTPQVAAGNGGGNESGWEAVAAFPRWDRETATMALLNTTGGEQIVVNFGVTNATISVNPGLRNNFTAVVDDQKTWDGGRRARCDFWLDARSRLL